MNKPMGLRQGVSYGRRNIPAGAQPWETIVRLTLVAGLTLCWWGMVLEPVSAQVPRIQGRGRLHPEWAMPFPHRPMMRQRSIIIRPG